MNLCNHGMIEGICPICLIEEQINVKIKVKTLVINKNGDENKEIVCPKCHYTAKYIKVTLPNEIIQSVHCKVCRRYSRAVVERTVAI